MTNLDFIESDDLLEEQKLAQCLGIMRGEEEDQTLHCHYNTAIFALLTIAKLKKEPPKIIIEH